MKQRVIAGAVTLVIIALFFARGRHPTDRRDAARGPAEAPPNFVSDTVCGGCHAQQTAQWFGSHHELAMTVADEGTVLGDFDGAQFPGDDGVTTFYRRNDRYYVEVPAAAGSREEREIRYTFGVYPLQQYLVDAGDGRFQALTIAWDIERRRWFDLHPEEGVVVGHPFHWTAPAYNWNSRCADCHSTNLRKNLRLLPEEDGSRSPFMPVTYETTWSEINVGCQACHGPGSRHVDWAQAGGMGNRADNLGFLVDLKEDASYEIDTCAPCHSRRHAISKGYEHGDGFMDHYVPSLLREGLYFADGQILDEVYVYGSFLQSRMFRDGVRCTDCHNPHSLSLKVEGNGLCVQCHQQRRNARFPDMPLRPYDTPAHHRHKVGSEGASCVACHMPSRTYMIVDPRHDHSFRVPRPDLSVELGTPNACNTCHADKSSEWAADAVARWFPESERTRHYGEILARGREGEGAEELRRLSLDSGSPAIVRATAIELAARRQPPGREFWEAVLNDESPLVRSTAAEMLSRASIDDAGSARERIALLGPLLSDPVRAVRVRAGRGLEILPENLLSPAQQSSRRAALDEFVAAQRARADWPDAHLNLGIHYENTNDLQAAMEAYRTALRVDPDFKPARFNLANLYNRAGRNGEAEGVLLELVASDPDDGEAHYSLGLLLAEMNRFDDAIVHLGTAERLLEGRARVSYNYGLALQNSGRRAEAERALLDAHRSAPDDADVLYALAVFYMQDESWDRALRYAERLSVLRPSDPAPREILRRIQRRLR